MREKQIYKIQRIDQLKALEVPLRQQILDAVSACKQPCSVKQIASLVGRPPDSLYFHIAKLVEVDLLLKSQDCLVAGKPTASYTTPSRSMRIQYDLESKSFRQTMAKIGRSLLRLANRDYERSLENKSSRPQGPSRDLWVARKEGFVSKNTLKELNQKFDEIFALLDQVSDREGDDRVAVTISIANVDSNF